MQEATYHYPAAVHLGVVPAAPRVVGGSRSDGYRYLCQRYRDPVQSSGMTPEPSAPHAPILPSILLPGVDR